MSNKEIKFSILEKERILYDLAGKNDYLNLCKSYGKYLSEMCLKASWINYFEKLVQMETPLTEVIEEKIFFYILKGHISYDEKMPQSFKEKYPNLFLPSDTPNEVKEKFYNRRFTILDFCNDNKLFSYFKNINVAYFLKEKFFWLSEYKGELDNQSIIKLAAVYEKINDNQLQEVFKSYVLENKESIPFDKLHLIVDLMPHISYSNSNEIINCRGSLTNQLLLLDNPTEKLNSIENIFLKNNLPYIGKVFSVFKLLHPNYDFNFSEFYTISPMLKRIPSNLKNTNIWEENAWRDIIIFSDLVKSALGSNNKSIKDYIENLEKGNELFLNLSSGNVTFEKLNSNELELLHIYTNHLNTLYNNTMVGKKENNILTGDITKDIVNLIRFFSPNGKLSYDLPDRIIKMYFHFAGFNTLEEVKTYRNEKLKQAEQRNRNYALQDLKIEVGDFIKGIEKIDYLHNILQNGSLAKEYLGASANSDSTPLDTDLSRILEKKESIEKIIEQTPSSGYGPIYFYLKNDERFVVTREKQDEDKNNMIFDSNKIEVFRTLEDDHYGIRTGFASSEINAIMMKEYDKRVGLEIALNGFYIPVYDFNGKIVFTPEDYDNLRSKMRGLSYYGENNYVFSEEIALIKVDSILEEQEREKPTIESYRSTIYKEVAKALQKYGLTLKNSISNDLGNGTVELIDTGSTNRSTFVPGDIDFDFVMRLDREILLNDKKLANLKNDLLQAFHQKDSKNVIDGNFRLKKAYLEGILEPLKIDITFLQKTDKVDYSTDLVIQDYLNTIKKQDEGQYKQIIGNIVIAKKVFKEAGCYKTFRSDSKQGGLGGVGIETFILQNGGSFITAAKNFLEVANGKNFKELKKEYCIWDFGNNFLAESRGSYPHDNFVADNMNELGYEKMKEALKNFLFTLFKEECIEEISLGR